MSFFDSLDIAASGLSAERVRMDVTAENLANAQTTRGANGQPYQRQEVILQQVGGFGEKLAGAMSGVATPTAGSAPAPAAPCDGSVAPTCHSGPVVSMEGSIGIVT